ncbi:helix-turn-helix transcriptional regulator [bacterium]|nr:helix-turn-helix transcriptional regulator [bacterium]
MKTEINKKLGKRIQYLRQQRGLSQEKLAESIDIATTSLSYVETGRGFMTLATLEKLARVLKVELYEIFRFNSVETNEEMFDYILKKVDLLKYDDEKLERMYNLVKVLL